MRYYGFKYLLDKQAFQMPFFNNFSFEDPSILSNSIQKIKVTMSRKILVFGASNSKNSINKKLATYAAKQIDDAEITILDLNDFEMPIYSIDRENEAGIPDLAVQFKQHIKEADGLVISFAEHNGAYTVAFKNVMDWMSRLEGSVWEKQAYVSTGYFARWKRSKFCVDFSLKFFQIHEQKQPCQFQLAFFS